MVEIFYNNKNAFSGVGPTPLVALSSEFVDVGSEWNQVTKIALEGNLTGKFLGKSSFDSLNDSLSLLVQNFSQNFKKLEIKESGVTLYSSDGVVVDGIDIPENSFYGLSPFTVNLTAYNSGVYENFYGIKNPVDTIEYQENRDGVLSYKRNISADGLNVNNKSAITNAKQWVSGRSVLSHNLEPILCKNNSNSFLLETRNETVDRLGGSYSLNLSYVKDVHSESIDEVLFSYSVDLSYDEESGVTTAKIKGDLKNNDLPVLRSKYSTLKIFEICNDACFKSTGKYLKNRLLSGSVQEDESQNILGFNAEYNDDDSLSDVIQDISVSLDYINTDCKATVTVSNKISCNVGSNQDRWAKVLNASKEFNPYIHASRIYSQELGGTLPVNVKSEFLQHNEFDSIIEMRTSYNDDRLPYGADEYVDSLESNVTYNPSVTILSPHASAFTPREHNIQNIGVAPRSAVDISVNIVLKAKVGDSYRSRAESLAIQEIARIKSNYLGSYTSTARKESGLRRWMDNSNFSLSERWSFEGQIYSEILYAV